MRRRKSCSLGRKARRTTPPAERRAGARPPVTILLGALGYTSMECSGTGRKAVYQEPFSGHSQLRVEVVGTRTVCEAIVRFVSQPEFAGHPVAAYLEGVEVI